MVAVVRIPAAMSPLISSLTIGADFSDTLPRLKAEASTLNTRAQANRRLTLAPVDRRCPCGFEIDCRVVIAVNYNVLCMLGVQRNRAIAPWRLCQPAALGFGFQDLFINGQGLAGGLAPAKLCRLAQPSRNLRLAQRVLSEERQ